MSSLPDSLYRSYSLEKSSNNGEVITSGSLTTWEDRPVSSLDVGDTFRPIPNGPLLTVKKVSINDNVIGTVAGKTVRQWQISVEGDNDASDSSLTHVLYNFNFNADEHSGTMEVTNTGDAPAITLNIGDTFSVPGVGRIPCVNVKGNDSYDDNGNHVWSVIYEGSDVQEKQNALPEDKYSLSIEQNDDEVVHSGSFITTSTGNTPSFSYQVGDKIFIPGIGNVNCTKISASDDFSDNGSRFWTITYEGSDANINTQQQGDTLSKVKYSFSIDKDGSSSITSGTMQVINTGDTPAFSLNVGDTFLFPGIGNLTCVNISGTDEYSDSGSRIWTVTYDGAIVQSQQAKYSLSIEKKGTSSISSGSVQTINDGDVPSLTHNIGSTINIPGLGDITCIGISASDEISEGGVRRWTVTYEGANEFTQNTKYSFTIDRSGQSCSMQVINEGDTPALSIQVGEFFTIPGLGQVTCTSISANDEYSESGTRVWNVTYESTPEQQNQTQTTKYSLSFNKDGDSFIQSGSMQVINKGDAPALSLDVGETFTIPGLGEVTCTSISANDEYSESGTRVWNVTYESNNAQQGQTQHSSYSFVIRKDSDSSVWSGSMQVKNEGEAPSLSYQVGDTFNIPGLGDVVCSELNVQDEYSDNGAHIWTVTYEGATAQARNPKYSFSIEQNEDSSVTTASMQVTNLGDSPNLILNVGDFFLVPGLGDVVCSNISVSDEYSEGGSHIWTVTYESKSNSSDSSSSSYDDSGSSSSMPNNEESASYELNGSFVRSIKGELIALRRSKDPIIKKTFTIYDNSGERISTPGSTYKGGLAISENIVKEDITVNNNVTSSYYKHVIEVES